MDPEIGVSGVYLQLLFYFDIQRCSSQTDSFYVLHINILKQNDPKVITQRLWYIHT